ncbi:MAG: cupredoxin domain-containing protein [Bellilinea sp.]
MNRIARLVNPVKSFIRKNWFSIVLATGIFWLPLPFPEKPPQERHIRIEASAYRFIPEEIFVNAGDQITIELVSTDVIHGLSLDGYSLVMRAEPGQTAKATFTADRSGVFRFRCAVPCGNLHPFMIGKLRVGDDIFLIRGIALGLLGIGVAMRIPSTFSKKPHIGTL